MKKNTLSFLFFFEKVPRSKKKEPVLFLNFNFEIREFFVEDAKSFFVKKKTKNKKNLHQQHEKMKSSTANELRAKLLEKMRSDNDKIESTFNNNKEALLKFRSDGPGVVGKLKRKFEKTRNSYIGKDGKQAYLETQKVAIEVFAVIESPVSTELTLPVKYKDEDMLTLNQCPKAIGTNGETLITLNDHTMERIESYRIPVGSTVYIQSQDLKFLDTIAIGKVVELRGLKARGTLPKAFTVVDGKDVENTEQKISVFLSCGSINVVQNESTLSIPLEIGISCKLERVKPREKINFQKKGKAGSFDKQTIVVKVLSFKNYDDTKDSGLQITLPVKYNVTDSAIVDDLTKRQAHLKHKVEEKTKQLLLKNTEEEEEKSNDLSLVVGTNHNDDNDNSNILSLDIDKMFKNARVSAGQTLYVNVDSKDWSFVDTLRPNEIIEIRGVKAQGSLGKDNHRPFIGYECSDIKRIDDLDISFIFTAMRESGRLKTTTFPMLKPNTKLTEQEIRQTIFVENDLDFENAESMRLDTLLQTGINVVPKLSDHPNIDDWLYKQKTGAMTAKAKLSFFVKTLPLPIDDQTLNLLDQTKATLIDVTFWQGILSCFQLFPGAHNYEMTPEYAKIWHVFGPIIFSQMSFAADVTINEESSRKYYDGINGPSPSDDFDRGFSCTGQDIVADINSFYLTKALPVTPEFVAKQLKINGGAKHNPYITKPIINLAMDSDLAPSVLDHPDYVFRAFVGDRNMNANQLSHLITQTVTAEMAGDKFVNWFLTNKRPVKDGEFLPYQSSVSKDPLVVYFAIYQPKTQDEELKKARQQKLQDVLTGTPAKSKNPFNALSAPPSASLSSSSFPIEEEDAKHFYNIDLEAERLQVSVQDSTIMDVQESQKYEIATPVSDISLLTEETTKKKSGVAPKKHSLKRDQSSISSSSQTSDSSSNKKPKTKN